MAADCPLPEVAAALSPFIQSRNEVSRIRLELQNYLQTELWSEETTLSSLSLAGSVVKATESPSSGLSGVRKAYWRALQAHTQAQEKYEALRAELDQLKHGKGASESPESGTSNSPNDGYLTLLRQREKHRKLKVIDRALSNVSSPESGASTNSLDDIVKAKVGEVPAPPTKHLSSKQNPEVEAKLLQLKKAIVAAKRKAGEQRGRITSPPNNAIDRSTPQGEVAGLQQALQVLTIWMEDQLTLIASAETDAQDSKDDQTTNGVHSEPPVSIDDIEKLYDQYLEARERLIETINEETSEPSTNGFSFDSETSGGRGFDAKASTKSSAEILLPFIPALIAAKQEEQTLVQQNSHTRKQMAMAEDEMVSVIQRFAGESHLVQPDATQGRDWTTAASESGKSTDKSIKDRLAAGEQAAEKASVTLNLIHSLPGSVQSAGD